MGNIGWVHFSPEFRDRVNSVLEMLEEEGMVDELGVGVFRDAIADMLFPGISTVQTRAKYFFIVPSIIKDYINQPFTKQTGLSIYLDNWEHQIMWNLASKYNYARNSDSGVIGITKRPYDKIARRPSSIYWNGIKKFDIIRTTLNLAEYLRQIDVSLGSRSIRYSGSNNSGTDDPDTEMFDEHGIKIPTYRKNWHLDLDLPLESDEADFLKNRIEKTVNGSLLAEIVSNTSLRKLIYTCDIFETFAPQALKIVHNEDMKETIRFAYDLNEVVKGLYYVYSNEINSKYYNDMRFFDKWENWRKNLTLMSLENLTSEKLRQYAPHAGFISTEFMGNVFDLIHENIINYDRLSELVKNQESKIKCRKSRFRQEFALDFKKGEGKSLSFMNYRYRNAIRIVKDIYKALL